MPTMQKRHSKPRAVRYHVKDLETLDFKDIDYKNVELIRQIISNYAKILPGNRTGATAKMQRKLSQAVKRARFMALLPYIRR